MRSAYLGQVQADLRKAYGETELLTARLDERDKNINKLKVRGQTVFADFVGWFADWSTSWRHWGACEQAGTQAS